VAKGRGKETSSRCIAASIKGPLGRKEKSKRDPTGANTHLLEQRRKREGRGVHSGVPEKDNGKETEGKKGRDEVLKGVTQKNKKEKRDFSRK